jgi:cell division protease FtsH
MANRLSDVAAPPSSSGTKASKDAAAGAQRWRLQPWWPIFLVIMLANYVVTQVFFSEPSSIAIPYSFFKQQVEAGNVEDVTSVGDSIQGHFKTTVTYPLEQSAAPTANTTPRLPPTDPTHAPRCN